MIPTAASGAVVRVGSLAFTGAQLLAAVALGLLLLVLGSLAVKVAREQ